MSPTTVSLDSSGRNNASVDRELNGILYEMIGSHFHSCKLTKLRIHRYTGGIPDDCPRNTCAMDSLVCLGHPLLDCCLAHRLTSGPLRGR